MMLFRLNRKFTMKRILLLLVSVLVTLVSVCAKVGAPIVQEESDPIIIGHRISVHSDALDGIRSVYVHLPDGYQQGNIAYPVVYVLDGSEHRFHEVSGTARSLALLGRIPPVIVVGIPSVQRTRDFTPPGSEPSVETPANAGGAEDFLRFLSDELIPYIDGHYRTTPHRTLVGSSFGGLFVIYATLERPRMFRGVISGSPSLWWDNRRIIRSMEKGLSVDSLGPLDLVVTMTNEVGQMRGAIEALTNLLEKSAPNSLAWTYHKFPSESHETGEQQSSYRGLLDVFSDWRFGKDVSDGGDAALKEKLSRRNAKYGIGGEASCGVYLRLGYHLLERGDPNRAVEFFREASELTPTAPEPKIGLVQAHLAAGRLVESLHNLRRAVELAATIEHPLLPRLRSELAKLEKRIGEIE